MRSNREIGLIPTVNERLSLKILGLDLAPAGGACEKCVEEEEIKRCMCHGCPLGGHY